MPRHAGATGEAIRDNGPAWLKYNFGGLTMNAGVDSIAWAKRLAVIAVVILLPACQSTNARQIGGLVGSIAGSIGGSYLGSYVGDTAGAIVGSVAGGLAGYFVGAEIGGYLGRDDKKKMAEATQRALDTGKTQTFNNPNSGVKGQAEVIPASEAAQRAPGECKTIRQTVVLKDETTYTEDVNSCK